MITEDYISCENAKLLKEKGFKIPYDSFRGVYINGIFKRLNPGDGYGCNSEDEIANVCSLQMAMKWLREVHNISVEPFVDFGSGDEYWWSVDVAYIKKNGLIDELCGYNSYEEACEAAIKYCLENLI